MNVTYRFGMRGSNRNVALAKNWTVWSDQQHAEQTIILDLLEQCGPTTGLRATCGLRAEFFKANKLFQYWFNVVDVLQCVILIRTTSTSFK